MSVAEDRGEVADLTLEILTEIRDETRGTNARLDRHEAKLDRHEAQLQRHSDQLDRLTEVALAHNDRLERLTEVARHHTDRLDRLTEVVARNGDYIRTLAVVVESGFRGTSRQRDSRADARRVEALEERVDRLELRLASGG